MHLAQGPQMHGRHHHHQQQQQQQLEAEGTSVSVYSALGAAAAQQNNAKDVAAESSALHLPSCDRATHKGHTADFLQQLFCCPLTQVSRGIAGHDEQACICSTAAVQHQCNAWGTGSKLQRRLGSAVHTNLLSG